MYSEKNEVKSLNFFILIFVLITKVVFALEWTFLLLKQFEDKHKVLRFVSKFLIKRLDCKNSPIYFEKEIFRGKGGRI